MVRLLDELGNPQRSFKSVHVGGSKGKGSTCAMLAGMLRNNDLRVGVYSSPHLLDVRERITLDGALIPETQFARLLGRVASIVEKMGDDRPTYFDVLTAVAFLYFAEQGVDVAIIEVGLGGRLDSTNVIKPEVCAITSVSLDHMAELGDNLESIAEEKAGILKDGVPVVSAPQPRNVKKVLKAAAEKHASTLYFGGDEIEYTYRFESSRATGPQARICVTTPHDHYEHLAVPLLGEHQAINCGVAVGVLDQLKLRGFAIDNERAVAGLAGVQLPGRMETICSNPRVLVDAAHNAASIEALMRAIGQNVPYDSMVVIFGCCADKDVPGMLRHIVLGADKVIFTSIKSPRSADPVELTQRFTDASGRMVQMAPTLAEAVALAEKATTREDLICITGSFYLVAEAKRYFADHPHRVPSSETVPSR